MAFKPKRYSSQKSHNDFGVTNWFYKKGVFDENEIRQIKMDYCNEKGLPLTAETKAERRIENLKINSFIQKNFLSFRQFANKVIIQCKEHLNR